MNDQKRYLGSTTFFITGMKCQGTNDTIDFAWDYSLLYVARFGQ